MLERTKHYMEAIALKGLFALFRALPLDTASKFGGWLARMIGRFLSAHKTAKKNLLRVFPHLSESERNGIINRMWDNLGRTAAELVYLPDNRLLERVEIIGAEYLEQSQGKPTLLFSGHLGNWELLASVAQHHNRPIAGVYREANNPIVDSIISNIRSSRYLDMIPKGRQGAVKIVRAIKNNGAIAMLVDQKMNDGISVPFFGIEAMTAPAIAELALRYDTPIIPARIVRVGGANFKGIVYPPIEYQKTGNKEQDTYNIMLSINQTLENWIKEYPEQWFWVHKRWGNII